MKLEKFYEYDLGMKPLFENLCDNRTHPQIPAEHIAKSIIYMPPLNLQSMLAVDQYARIERFRDIIGSKRPIALSDTTLQRVLPKLELEPIHRIQQFTYSQIVKRGLSKFQLPTGKKLRIGVADGSGFGHDFASVVAIIGNEGIYPLHAHAFKKHGKELPSSRAAISHLTKILSKSWCDVLVYDGLDLVKKDFSLAKEKHGFDLVVKTSEVSSRLIQDASSFLFSNNPDVVSDTGIDTYRKVKFDIKVIRGFIWKGLDYPLSIAAVTEVKLNPKPGEPTSEVFYVVTTKQDLTPDEMRIIAHARWEVENNVFKRLNSLIKSKSVHSHNFSTLIVLLLLWLIGLSLLQMFILVLKKLDWCSCYGKVRFTLNFLLKHLEWSLFGSSTPIKFLIE